MPESQLRKRNFSLRSMTMDDRDLVLEWRNSERIRNAMYTDHVISRREHQSWIKSVLASDREDYNIFEYCGRPIGVANATAIDRRDRRCSWAYYLGVEDAPRGSGSAMEWFMLNRIFGDLDIRKLCCEVFAYNESPLRLHKKFHFAEEGRLAAHRLKDGHYEDVILLALFDDQWLRHRDELAAQVFATV